MRERVSVNLTFNTRKISEINEKHFNDKNPKTDINGDQKMNGFTLISKKEKQIINE